MGSVVPRPLQNPHVIQIAYQQGPNSTKAIVATRLFGAVRGDPLHSLSCDLVLASTAPRVKRKQYWCYSSDTSSVLMARCTQSTTEACDFDDILGQTFNAGLERRSSETLPSSCTIRTWPILERFPRKTTKGRGPTFETSAAPVMLGRQVPPGACRPRTINR